MSAEPGQLQITRFATFIVLLIASLLAVAIVISPDSVPSTRAQVTCGSGTPCPELTQGVPDRDVDSSLNVTYRTNEDTPKPIEPQTGTHWRVVAKYASTDDEGYDCVCAKEEYTATFEIDWNGTNDEWDIANLNGFGGPINSVSADDCGPTNSCVDGMMVHHDSQYKLHVNVDNPIVIDCPIDGPREFWLDQVLYTTTVVDNGKVIVPAGLGGGGCTLGIANKTPQTQVFQAGDNGQFECNDSCPFGPSLVIQYNP